MKISRSIEDRFKRQEGYALAIKNKLSGIISDWCRFSGWLFEDRVKKIESFAQKVEQPRIRIIDDVYAATIIVKNKIEIMKCCRDLESPTNSLGLRFEYKFPNSFNETNFDPNSFVFDSVRMYFKPPVPDVDAPEYVEEIFEIQIKTLLEHAWDKATHDSVYKSSVDQSWAKSRLASQIKALLENAELALIETELLSQSVILQKKNSKITQINSVSAFYRAKWNFAALPKDIKRLAENTQKFLKCIEKDLLWLEMLIDEETNKNRGSTLLNLSPYWIIVQAAIIEIGWSNFLVLLNSTLKENEKFPLIKELDFQEMGSINVNDPVYVLK